MKARLRAILIGTHLLALGAGWWFAGKDEPIVAPGNQPARTGKTSRPPRPERRVSTADLLAAYRNPELWGEALRRRNEASRPRAEPPHGTPAVSTTPEQRAAEIADIAGAMQKELAAVDAGKAYDYQLTKALVARWMKEDPAACAAWLGQIKMRTGWGDPFVAFAKTLPPGELLALMEDGWLQVNRRRALEYLAAHLGERSVAELPAVLSRLSAEEANAFLESASRQARVEDAAAWLDLISGDEEAVKSLASRWIDGNRQGWQEKAELAMAAAAGTPADAIFRARWEREMQLSEKERELARAAHDPEAALAALTDLNLRQTDNVAVARHLAETQMSVKYREGSEIWQRETWERDQQLCLLGQQKLEDALTGRLDAIAAVLPELVQEGARASSWRDAMRIDPAATLEVAIRRDRAGEAVQGAMDLIGEHDTSTGLRAEVLLALAEQGLWKQDGWLPDVKSFTSAYLRDDPEAARLWMARLPAEFSRATKEDSR